MVIVLVGINGSLSLSLIEGLGHHTRLSILVRVLVLKLLLFVCLRGSLELAEQVAHLLVGKVLLGLILALLELGPGELLALLVALRGSLLLGFLLFDFADIALSLVGGVEKHSLHGGTS